MSRFNEGDGDYDFAWAWQGWEDSALSGKNTRAALKEFAAHMDAMPRKRILVGTFANIETGEACTVGEFCKMRGVTSEELAKTARRSEAILEDGMAANEAYDWSDGPTVNAGHAAGLPRIVAFMLAQSNDSLEGLKVNTNREIQGPQRQWWFRCPRPEDSYEHKPVFETRDMTPEECWSWVRGQLEDLIARAESIAQRRGEKRKKRAEEKALTLGV